MKLCLHQFSAVADMTIEQLIRQPDICTRQDYLATQKNMANVIQRIEGMYPQCGHLLAEYNQENKRFYYIQRGLCFLFGFENGLYYCLNAEESIHPDESQVQRIYEIALGDMSSQIYGGNPCVSMIRQGGK